MPPGTDQVVALKKLVGLQPTSPAQGHGIRANQRMISGIYLKIIQGREGRWSGVSNNQPHVSIHRSHVLGLWGSPWCCVPRSPCLEAWITIGAVDGVREGEKGRGG